MIKIMGKEELNQEAVSMKETEGMSPENCRLHKKEESEIETATVNEPENLSPYTAEPQGTESPDNEAVIETEAINPVKNDSKEYYTSFKDEYDIEHPGLPAPFCDYYTKSGISAYAISQKGQSHIKNDSACQDRSGVRILKNRGIVVAAIADGVGSCTLSDLGAECAVNAALNMMESELGKVDTLDKTTAGSILRKTMSFCYDTVDRLADKMTINVYSFQSTLTISIYDGKDLYVGHAGDDGVVALLRDGKYHMVTVRHKGKEASSVYPLQSRSTWQFGMSADVIGFVMCTDGVLDSFVGCEFENNRIYFPFIESEFKKPALSLNDVRKTCEQREKILFSDKYRAKVTDDLTFVSIVNHSALSNLSSKPVFDKSKWDSETEIYKKIREDLLNRESSVEKRKNGGSSAPHGTAGAMQNSSANNNQRRTENDFFRSGENKTADKKANSDIGNLSEGKYKAGYKKIPLEHNRTAAGPLIGQSGRYKEMDSNSVKVVEGTIRIIEGAETVTEGLVGMAGGFFNEFFPDIDNPDDFKKRR